MIASNEPKSIIVYYPWSFLFALYMYLSYLQVLQDYNILSKLLVYAFVLELFICMFFDFIFIAAMIFCAIDESITYHTKNTPKNSSNLLKEDKHYES